MVSQILYILMVQVRETMIFHLPGMMVMETSLVMS
jgi:hypothetical protein